MDIIRNQEELEARVEYLEGINRFTLGALEMAASLGDFQSSFKKLQEPSTILKETRSQVKRLIPFQTVLFYLVDETNSSFYLADSDPQCEMTSLKEEVEFLIGNGTFAWALRENRAVSVLSKDFKKRLILHVMATYSRIRSMFVGFLDPGEKNIPEVSLSLLSVILLKSANALESFELYRMVQKALGELENRIKERTLELAGTNERLQLEITERRRAEEALRQSEEKYRTLVENVPIGVYRYTPGPTGRCLMANPTFLRMFGFDSEAQLKQILMADLYMYPDERKVFTENLLARKSVTGVELQFKRKDGTPLWGSVTARVVYDEKTGEVAYFDCSVEDITERKQSMKENASLQNMLRQSQKMEAIGRLAGGISHDFNNILTVIRGYSELFLMELKEGDPLRENIKEIQKAADRAVDLTRQLLAFSRRQVMEMKIINLNPLIRDLDKMLRRVIGEDIDLVAILDEDLGRVKVDPGQIEQVILNLAVNARDAMSSGGKLTIETANLELDETYARSHAGGTPGRYVMLSLSDTGEGMTPEVRERIFEPFFTTKGKDKGTGLGLSTVYGIVKQSGGNIYVYSEPGQGTTFKLYLPRVDESLGEVEESVVEEEPPRGIETVLVVEDQEEVRKLAVGILKRQGYKVLEAAQGGEGFLICEKYKKPIHLMLTDVVMPGMSGRELAKRLESLHPEMKVLYMSGYAANAIVHHGVLDKGINYIQKPFTVDGLARKVRDVLNK